MRASALTISHLSSFQYASQMGRELAIWMPAKKLGLRLKKMQVIEHEIVRGCLHPRLPPVLSWVGGKYFLVKKLCPLIPPHQIYVEPFIGGGSLFFR